MTKNESSKLEPLLFRGREVALLIGCSRALAYRLMQRGILPTVRVPGGRSVRVPREALIEWIRTNTQIVPRDRYSDSGTGGVASDDRDIKRIRPLHMYPTKCLGLLAAAGIVAPIEGDGVSSAKQARLIEEGTRPGRVRR